MRIDNVETAAAFSITAAAVVGGIGAYIVKPIFESISPLGVALTCAVTTAIGLAVLFSETDFSVKFMGFMAAYPIGLGLSNLMGCRVHLLDPAVSVLMGGIVLTPMVVTALFCAATFT